MDFILASASPRRKELLEQIGMDFTVIPAVGEEKITSDRPHEAVLSLSAQKAREIANLRINHQDEVIIGADTVVAYQNEILGKPKNEADAHRMLSLLQGHTHQVYTGVCLLVRKNQKETCRNFYQMTEVAMYPMNQKEIDYYVATKEPLDKAGGYGIQGRCAAFIEKINGDYNNVVGLPVAAIYQELVKLCIDIY